METNKKPNELIFPITVAHYPEYSEVQSINSGNHVFYLKQQHQGNRIEIASSIVTACNSYEPLKQQNEEYRAMLALIRDCYKTDAKGELDRGNTTMFNYYQNQASHIDNLLTKYQK